MDRLSSYMYVSIHIHIYIYICICVLFFCFAPFALQGQSLAESALVSHPQSARVVELAEQLLQVLKKG